MKRKLFSLAFAFAASVCLWVYVVTVVNQVTTESLVNVPVTFSGADQIRDDFGLVITSGADAAINLRVTCQRSTLAKLTSNGVPNVSAVIDVSRIRKAGDYNLTYSLVYPNGVSNSQIVSASGTPRTIPFTVERFITKSSVPVKGVLNGSVAGGYYEAPMECSPRELTIEGPESVVSRVSYAQVIMEQDGLTETVSQICPFTLVDENGDAVEPDYLTVTAGGVAVTTVEARQPVLAIKELPLVPEFSAGGGATSDDVRWRAEPQTITVAGDAEDLASINSISLGNFDLAQIEEPVDETVAIVLPDTLVNISDLQTANVRIEIDESRLSTKNVRLTDFWTVNRSPEYYVDVLTVQLMVRVRGPKETVSRITSENLRALIDASGLNLGTQSVPVTIEIVGASGAAALGTYTASVTMSPQQEAEGEENP